jgi:hypothetical protein
MAEVQGSLFDCPWQGILRHCTSCHLWVHRSGFYSYKGQRLMGACKICACRKTLAIYHADPMPKRIQMAEKKRSRKLAMIEAYGGECQCCGEKRWQFLGIDHIHGGGNAEQRELGGSSAVIRKLENAGWPKDEYRLLCHNCNCGRSSQNGNGVCPHVFVEPLPAISVEIKPEQTERRCAALL